MVPFSVDLTKIPGAMSRGFCFLQMQMRVARRERSITSDVLQAMYYKRCIADCRAHCIQWPVIVQRKELVSLKKGLRSAARGDGVNDG